MRIPTPVTTGKSALPAFKSLATPRKQGPAAAPPSTSQAEPARAASRAGSAERAKTPEPAAAEARKLPEPKLVTPKPATARAGEGKQPDSRTAAKPSERKPAAVERKPADSVKKLPEVAPKSAPAHQKLAPAEAKAAESKPVEPKLVEAKPTQPGKKPVGVARGPGDSPSPPASAASAEPMFPLADTADDSDEEMTRISSPGALAGLFSEAVRQAPASAPAHVSGDEWFVGINGVPVGPIRLSELRSKAASGAITRESLVWREGFEEWRPLSSFPELVAVVEESVSSARASAEPLALAASGVVASPGATPFASPFGPSASPVGAVTGTAVVTDDLEAVLRPRKSRVPWAWIAIVLAMACGMVIGITVFGTPQQPKEIIKYVEVPAKQAEPAAQPAASAEVAEVEAPQNNSKTTSKSGSGKTASKTESAESDSKLTGGLKGLGLSGLSAGPKGPAGSTPGTGSGGGQLDSSQVQALVARYTPSVKRSCWQPALDTRDKDAPTSARVGVTITVGPSGSVQNVTTTGDPKGYRSLASCISSRVRGWQFPATGGSTTVNVPFVFVAQ